MLHFHELTTTDADFKALMIFLLSFIQITDNRFAFGLRPLLKTVEYLRPVVIQVEGKIADKAFYIVRGIIFAYYTNLDNELMVFRIYHSDEIALIPESFITGNVAQYGLMACGDTRLVEISMNQVHRVYKDFPVAVMLDMKILARMFAKDRFRDELLRLPTLPKILNFYKRFPELLNHPTYFFRDIYAASYLQMSPVTFSRYTSRRFPEIFNKKI